MKLIISFFKAVTKTFYILFSDNDNHPAAGYNLGVPGFEGEKQQEDDFVPIVISPEIDESDKTKIKSFKLDNKEQTDEQLNALIAGKPETAKFKLGEKEYTKAQVVDIIKNKVFPTDDPKPYKILDKSFNREELIPSVKTAFPGINFETLPADQQEIYLNAYVNAEVGKNQEAWQKSNDQKSQQLAKRITEVNERTNKLRIWEEDIIKRENAARTTAAIDIKTIEDVNEKVTKAADIANAKRDLLVVQAEKNLLNSNRNALALETYLVTLEQENPAVFSFSRNFHELLSDWQNKKEVNTEEIAKGLEIIEMINSAENSMMKPGQYYSLYIKSGVLKNRYPVLYGIVSKGESTNTYESEAEKLRKELEKNKADGKTNNQEEHNRHNVKEDYTTASRDKTLEAIYAGRVSD